MMPDSRKVADHWSADSARVLKGESRLFWWEAGPEIQRYINRSISGDPEQDFVAYTLARYFDGRLPLQRCLSLGCGSGVLERNLASRGAFQHCDAFDIAPGSIQVAERLALQQGIDNISYGEADINTIILPRAAYDAVWIGGAMHHFEALEHICEQIRFTLRPGGLLILNEYIGPSRFQFPARQKEIANLCLQLLPAPYRALPQQVVEMGLERSSLRGQSVRWLASRVADKVRDGDLVGVARRRWQLYRQKIHSQSAVKITVGFPSSRDVVAVDPSEAVRSDEIIPVLQQHFEIVEKRDWGGNILQFLLADIAGNFASDDAQARAVLGMLINIEQTLLLSGEFESDHAYILARPLAG